MTLHGTTPRPRRRREHPAGGHDRPGVRTKLLLDSTDAALLVQPSPVNARKRAL